MLLTTMICAYRRAAPLIDITDTDDLILDKDGLDLISSIDVRIDTLCELVEKSSPENMATVSEKLQGLSRDSLARHLIDARMRKKRMAMWLINREYTRRGVLPIFRQLPHPDDDTELMADLFWYDLEWLNARHQGHKPFLTRWKEIFRSKEFPHKTAKYIYESTGCQIWQTVKGLALENDWQTELNFIKTGVHRSAIARLDRLKPEVLNSLRVAHYERGRKLQSAEDKKTIERRIDIWFCGCIAKKSPQQTAYLYEAMTGNKITRQLAAKLMEQVKKDVPGAFRKNWEPS